MKSFWRVCMLGCLAGGLFLVGGGPASAGCNRVLGTADGMDKPDAVAGAQAALDSAIKDFRAQRRVAVTATPIRPKPQPYWRDVVTADLFFKPDVITARSHTVCWRGVVSPVVCTAAAKVCW
jgi:hypothetical protein